MSDDMLIDMSEIPIIGQSKGPEHIINPTPRADNKNLCNEIDFEPLGNWCLVQSVDGTVEVRGLYVPEAHGQTFRKGVVMATGRGTVYSSGTFIECSLQVGDVVLYGKAAGLEVTIKEGSFLLIRESECFGKVSKK